MSVSAPPPKSTSIPPPGSVADGDRYELLFGLAAGGMAEVWVARQRGTGGFERPVALKKMLPHLRHDETFVAMFLDEGRVAGWLSHPHIVSTLDVGLDREETPFLVMELVQGLSLAQMLRGSNDPLPLEVACEVLAQAADGLDAAHHASSPAGRPLEIVHRDVSPQNVLVGVDGRARISDFGVARALERVTQTSTGEVKGKIAYFSPEQATAKALTPRSDVFALGIVAWETLSGKRLFAGSSPIVSLQLVCTMDIPRLDAVRPEVPKAIADVVAHALVRDVDARLPSAAAFAEGLRHALRESGLAPASARVIGATVRERGGAKLEALSQRISAEFASRVPSVPPPAAAAVEDPSIRVDVAGDASGTMSVPTHVRTRLSLPEAPEEPQRRPPEAPAARKPRMQERLEPPARTVPWPAVIAIVAGAVLVALAASWLLDEDTAGPSADAPPSQPSDPPQELAAPSAPAAPPPSEVPSAPTTVILHPRAESAIAAPTPVALPHEEAPTEPAPAAIAPAAPAPTAPTEPAARRAPPRERAEAAPEPEPEAAPEPQPAPARAPAAEPAPTPEPEAPARRRGPLIEWGTGSAQ